MDVYGIMIAGSPPRHHTRLEDEHQLVNGIVSTTGSAITASSSNTAAPPLPQKRLRKSRGRGLRTKTGCLTCRSRHKKCDEERTYPSEKGSCIRPVSSAAYPCRDSRHAKTCCSCLAAVLSYFLCFLV